MAANTNPIFSKQGAIGRTTWLPGTTANTKSDGTGTIGTDILILVSPATDGSFIQYIRAYPVASVASTATTPTVLRLYISTQNTGATTNGNTYLFAEVAAPAQTADVATSATTPLIIPMGISIPPSGGTPLYVLVSMHHAAAANTAWEILAIGGDY